MASNNTPAVIEPKETAALASDEATQKSSTAVSVWEGFESDGTEDVAPSFPYIKLVQATSSMEGASKHAGDFWRSDTETYHNPLDVVALFQKQTRAFFKEGENQPACRSNDGITPAPNQPLWENMAAPASCADCPFSVWGEDGTPSECSKSTVVLVEHEGELAQLRLSGTSIGPWRRFIASKLKSKKLPLCSQRLSLTTVEKSKPGKKWFELMVDAERMPDAEARAYNAIIAYERGRFERATDEPHDDGWETPDQAVEAKFVGVEDD